MSIGAQVLHGQVYETSMIDASTSLTFQITGVFFHRKLILRTLLIQDSLRSPYAKLRVVETKMH